MVILFCSEIYSIKWKEIIKKKILMTVKVAALISIIITICYKPVFLIFKVFGAGMFAIIYLGRNCGDIKEDIRKLNIDKNILWKLKLGTWLVFCCVAS